MSTLIPLPWSKPPITLNARQHHHVKAKAVAQALLEARVTIRAADVDPMDAAHVILHYRAPDRRRRDADNLAATLKVVQDALVAEGVIPRDDWECVPASGQRIHPPVKPAVEPAMWVELIDVREPFTTFGEFNARVLKARGGEAMKHVLEVTEPTPCSEPANRYAFEQVIEVSSRPNGHTDTKMSRRLIRFAKDICGGCPAREQCLAVHGRDYGLGVVAGATDAERQAFFGEESAS